MLYTEYLAQEKTCPFCENIDARTLSGNNSAFLTYALAPYHKHHLLVVPRAHITSLFAVTTDQKHDIDALLQHGMHALEALGYQNFTMLVREGNNKTKSIQHLHYHLIPNTEIGSLNHDGKERAIMADDEVAQTTKEILTALEQA